MKRRWLGGAAALAGLLAIAWAAGSTTQHAIVDPTANLSPDRDEAGAGPPSLPARANARPPAAPPVTSTTPMAERVAVLGVLNKRDGRSREITLHPGQAARFGDLVVRLRACDSTADWEPEKLTGAFVQAIVRQPDGAWRRVFSGWLYKETPSLNVVENPLYDVWPKSCAMRHPDAGPDTVAAVGASGAPSRLSRAKKLAPAGDAPPPAVEPSPSAESNSAT